MAFVTEDGGIRSHDTHIGVAFHACHIDGFSKSCVEVTKNAEVACNGIFTSIDTIAVTIEAVVFVILLTEPRSAPIVVLIHQIHRTSISPSWVVRSPRLDIAYQNHFRVLRLNGIVELLVALNIVVALVVIVVEGIVVVLVAYLNKTYSEWFGMTIFSSKCTISRRNISVAVFNQIESFLNIIIQVLIVYHPAVTESDIANEERLCAKVLRQLEQFVQAQSVAHSVAPVYIPMSRPLLDRTNGLLPLETIGLTVSPSAFDVASAGEADKSWMKLSQHLGKVAPTTVLSVLESGRHQGNDVHVDGHRFRSF